MLLLPTEPIEVASSFTKRESELETPELLGLARIQGLTQALEIIAAHLGELSVDRNHVWLASAFLNPFVRGHNGTAEGYRLKMLPR